MSVISNIFDYDLISFHDKQLLFGVKLKQNLSRKFCRLLVPEIVNDLSMMRPPPPPPPLSAWHVRTS